MSIITYIAEFRNAILIILNAGIVARIMKIIADGQHEEDQDTKGMVKRHLLAAAVGNTITVIVTIASGYYS